MTAFRESDGKGEGDSKGEDGGKAGRREGGKGERRVPHSAAFSPFAPSQPSKSALARVV